MERDPTPLVLCVDDDPPVLSALRRVTAAEPYRVVTLEQPAEALQFVRRRPVDLVISDERMPTMNGTDLLRWIGGIAPSTPSILLTAYPESVAGIRLGRLGVRQFLTKPWNDDELRRAIREALGIGRPAESRVYDVPGRGIAEVVVRVDGAGHPLSSVLASIEAVMRRPGASFAGLCVILEDFVGPLDLLMRAVRHAAADYKVLVRMAGLGGLAPVEADRRLLVVAPDPVEGELLGALLAGIGHHPTVVGPQDDAGGEFDAVLVDLDTDVDDAARLIEHLPEAPIVLIADAEDPWPRMTFPGLGVRRCLGKPYTSRELCLAVDDACVRSS